MTTMNIPSFKGIWTSMDKRKVIKLHVLKRLWKKVRYVLVYQHFSISFTLIAILLGAFNSRNRYNSYDTTTEYKSDPGYWMGAASIELPGHWFWMQGKRSVDFTIFDSKEINVTDSSCLYFDKKNMYQARNIGCHTLMYSICEKKIPA